jgi:hypothetical protein
MLHVSEKSVVVLEPQFEEADDASNHGEFSIVGVRQVDFDVILK